MRPIFIGGCDRSGTTMLGSILGLADGACCLPESQFIKQVFQDIDIDVDNVNPSVLLDYFINSKRYKKMWENIDFTSQALFNAKTYPEFVFAFMAEYADKYYGKPDIDVWVDQTPNNLKYAKTLLRLFPDAKFIHIIRDGRAVTSSLLSLSWGPNNVVEAADYWMGRCSHGLAAEALFGSDRIMRVHYEQLVSEPETFIHVICRFCGVEYSGEMLSGGSYKAGAYNAAQHELVGKAPDKSRINAWKEKLTPREIEIFEFISGELLELLGYEQLYGVNAKDLTSAERKAFKRQAHVERFKKKLRKLR